MKYFIINITWETWDASNHNIFIKEIRKVTLSYTLCYTLYFKFYLEKQCICEVTLSYKVLGKHKVNQGLTTLIVHKLNIGGCGGMAVARLVHELIM
jgi:hypothetical protein